MSKSSGIIAAFLAGAATGAILGILYAPDKGSNTRDKLSFQLDKYREKLDELRKEFMDGKNMASSSAAKSEGERVVNDARLKAEQLLNDVDDLIGQIRSK
ncbi:YtxH domain-containing protein [Cytophagales bacterium LB-30]|uniref:YtxH domain-containing protein n=1 Tax=Shiella aurantiaca TaxID=3058365 RepID=A0ABT8F6B4_9BACT|nr:YtxH domain-containing protein [Shiella aurantiaca]MDN4165985.1 YtxH domain-containing protein [Shiella aurantiaca]